METAKENFEFTIFKGDYNTILSRILIATAEHLYIIFPHYDNNGSIFVILVDHKEFIRGKSAELISGNGNDTSIYLIALGNALSKTLFHPHCRFLQNGNELLECSVDEMQLLKKIAKRLYLNYSSKDFFTTRWLYLSMILTCLQEFLDRNRTFHSRQEALSQEFLKILYSENCPEHNVRYYAEQLYVSRRYLTKAVHSCLGESPKTLIDRQIINIAKRLLIGTIPVYEVADRLKFESQGSFATFFKKHKGCTPTEYRTRYLTAM